MRKRRCWQRPSDGVRGVVGMSVRRRRRKKKKKKKKRSGKEGKEEGDSEKDLREK